MKTRLLLSRVMLVCSLVLVSNTLVSASDSTWQDKTQKITVPSAEAKAAKAVEAAPDVTAKLVAAEDFVKKYPLSKVRPQVAGYLVNQVFGVTDPTQKLASGQKYVALFSEATEVKMVQPALIDALIQLKRFDEAFETGAAYLANDTEDVQVRLLLAITGAELARTRNVKHIKATQEYGSRTIELLETDKKPATMEADVWIKQKTLLPTLYQQMAIISLVEQKPAEAQIKLEKAVKIDPADPFNYFLLGGITNNDYQSLAMSLRGMPDSKSKEEMLKKATQLLDKVIEQYARAAALSEGKPQYQAMHQQVTEDLTTYYKYRHNNSAEGLQKYIDTFKTP